LANFKRQTLLFGYIFFGFTLLTKEEKPHPNWSGVFQALFLEVKLYSLRRNLQES
jgi:hypothetical protein